MWAESWLLGLIRDSQLPLADVFLQLLLFLFLLFSVYFFMSPSLQYIALIHPFFSFPQLVKLLFADEPHFVLFPTEILSVRLPCPLSLPLIIILLWCLHKDGRWRAALGCFLSISWEVQMTHDDLVYFIQEVNIMCLHNDVIEVVLSSWMNKLPIQYIHEQSLVSASSEKAVTMHLQLSAGPAELAIYFDASLGVTQPNLWKPQLTDESQ